MGIYNAQWAVAKLVTEAMTNGVTKTDVAAIIGKDSPVSKPKAVEIAEYLTLNKEQPNVTYAVYNLASE